MRWAVSHMYAHVAKAQPCVNHMQRYGSLILSTCMVQRDNSAIDRVKITCIFCFISSAKSLNQWRRGENQSAGRDKSSGDKLQYTSHTRARNLKPWPRLQPTDVLHHWWQVLAKEADLLSLTPWVCHPFLSPWPTTISTLRDRLVGLVVKASASRRSLVWIRLALGFFRGRVIPVT